MATNSFFTLSGPTSTPLPGGALAGLVLEGHWRTCDLAAPSHLHGQQDSRAVAFTLGCVSQCLELVIREKEADLVCLAWELRHFFYN